jgi:hypothetical protein
MSRAVLLLAALPLVAQYVPPPGESLEYAINWPGGLSLGEARLKSAAAAGGYNFEFSIDASIPGFAVKDLFHSTATQALCSSLFEKRLAHGKRKAEETLTFDQAGRKVTRETTGGGKSVRDTGECARDALAALHYIRRELAAGRIPPPQTVWFGAPYELRLERTGTVTQPAPADRFTARLKGPASEHAFELHFGRDAARRLLLVRLPLPLGAFSMELVP